MRHRYDSIHTDPRKPVTLSKDTTITAAFPTNRCGRSLGNAPYRTARGIGQRMLVRTESEPKHQWRFILVHRYRRTVHYRLASVRNDDTVRLCRSGALRPGEYSLHHWHHAGFYCTFVIDTALSSPIPWAGGVLLKLYRRHLTKDAGLVDEVRDRISCRDETGGSDIHGNRVRRVE